MKTLWSVVLALAMLAAESVALAALAIAPWALVRAMRSRFA
jgi:hypothetical protein